MSQSKLKIVSRKNSKKILLENLQDIQNFFNEVPKQDIASLKETYTKLVNKGHSIILSQYPHPMSGFHTWCTETKELS